MVIQDHQPPNQFFEYSPVTFPTNSKKYQIPFTRFQYAASRKAYTQTNGDKT